MFGFSELRDFLDILGRYYILCGKTVDTSAELFSRCNNLFVTANMRFVKETFSYIQNAYNGPRKGAKHRTVPLEKLQFIRVLVGLNQELKAQNYEEYLAFSTR